MSDNNSDSFKFVDRRRVDAEGKDRGVDEKTAPKSEASATKSSGAPKGEQGALPAEIGFSEFIMSFATQALMQLGQMQPPPGVNVPKDIRAAKQTIDIIQMLETKTKGNLDQTESLLISDILHNLRLAYVNVMKGA
jgi:hypothetical protein